MAADRVWDEAERLVAAAIAAVSMATGGVGAAARSASGGGSFANGSPECCVCPVCRVIAAMRDPKSDLADRLTAGVSDLATGVASLLRNLAGGQGDRDAEPEPAAEGDEFWESLRRKAADAAKARAHSGASTVGAEAGGRRRSTEDDPWRMATTASHHDLDTSLPPPAPKPMAKKAARKVVRTAPVPPAPPAEPVEPPAPAPSSASPAPARKVAQKAVAKKAVAKKAVAKKVGPREEPT